MAAPPNDSPNGLAQERLPELDGRPELRRGVPPLEGAGADATGQVRGGVLVVAHPQRRRAPELHIELEGRIAHRLCERGQLGKAVEPLAGPAQHRERVVAGRKQDPPVGRRRDERQRLLDEPERLFGGIGGEGGGRRIDREARRTGRVAGCQRVLGQHRQSGGGRVAAIEQQVDHCGVDLLGGAPIERRPEANWRTCSCVNV